MSNDPEIIGFDLGHGESALTVTRMSQDSEPMPLQVTNTDNMITAVGRTEKGEIRLGNQAIRLAHQLVESYVRFKDPELDDHPTAGKATRLFVSGIAEKLRDGSAKLSNFDQALFYVGCPSEWSNRTQKKYRALLKESGLPNVKVVPESRAAFIFSREVGELDEEELLQKVLLIDVGSSTTDLTVSDGLNEHPIDLGHNVLGAGLLDQLIFDRVVVQSPNPDEIKNYLETHPVKGVELDVKCRQAKHEYFNEFAGTGESVNDVFLAGQTPLVIVLNDAVMAELLEAPIDKLGGLSWRSSFRQYLNKARESMGGSPDHIIVTGGAARMPIVQDLVKAMFPEAKIVMGKQPELAISRGLAYFGRAHLRSSRFQNDVTKLIKENKVDDLVLSAIPLLYSKLATTLAEGIVQEVIYSKVEKWRNNHIKTMRQLENQIEADAKTWLKGSRAKERITKVVADWLKRLIPDIKTLTDPICLRYGLDTAALELKPETHLSSDMPELEGLTSTFLGKDFDDFADVLNLIVSTVVALIVGGSGVALLHLPLFGQVAAGVIAFFVFSIGKDEARGRVEEWAKDRDFGPAIVRRRLISDDKVKNMCQEIQKKLSVGIKEGFKKADEKAKEKPYDKTLAEKVTAEIDAGIRQRAYDSILLFEKKIPGN